LDVLDTGKEKKTKLIIFAINNVILGKFYRSFANFLAFCNFLILVMSSIALQNLNLGMF